MNNSKKGNIDYNSSEYMDINVLNNILEQLKLGNLAVIDINAVKVITAFAEQYSQMQVSDFDDTTKGALETLVKIGNILYNRTDMNVLPVEDGIYDLLMEIYKKIDPNFQVGSFVADFSSTNNELQISKNAIVNPVSFIDNEKDEVRMNFENELLAFNRSRLNTNDVFKYRSPISFESDMGKISKRTHDTKHNHPSLVGTLDKAKYVLINDAYAHSATNVLSDNISILERDFFGDHITKGVIRPKQKLDIVLELKYDGISVEADCTDEILSARTRGDTGVGEAADISGILKGYRFPNNIALKDRVVGVKFEAIITNSALEEFNKTREHPYANCRTAIIGLFGSSDAYRYQKYITLIPLAVDRKDVPEVTNRVEEIELMNRCFKTHGEPLRYTTVSGDLATVLYLTKKFVEEAKFARNYLDFAFDGVVVSYLDERIRDVLGRKNSINKYSIAVKFDPMEKQAIFLGYTFEVGSTGNICPMIHYTPVEFFGTVHTKSSGASLKRFNELALKVGDTINVTYQNDVMPYVTSLDCEHNRTNQAKIEQFIDHCPVCGSRLVVSDSGKTANCPNIDCPGRQVSRMTNMLQKLGLKGFADESVQALHVYTLHDLLQLTPEYITEKLGIANGAKLVANLDKLMKTPMEDCRLLGSLGFSNIGIQKFRLIFQVYTLSALIYDLEHTPDIAYRAIIEIPGISTSTAEVITTEYPQYQKDILDIYTRFTVIDSKNISFKKQIRFSGCRNQQLLERLSKDGYDITDGSVTQKTDILLVPYEGFTSSKTNKVSSTTQIIPIQEFTSNINKYLK